MNPVFYGVRTRIDLFELSRTRVSGHNGRTGKVLDVGVTLTGSSDEDLDFHFHLNFPLVSMFRFSSEVPVSVTSNICLVPQKRKMFLSYLFIGPCSDCPVVCGFWTTHYATTKQLDV
jgi:hypothetical protein